MTRDDVAPRDRAMRTGARRVVVTGRVQGVFFRASTRREARRHDVGGWVRNRPDGRVEAHLEGSSEAVAAVEEWMRAGGPPTARVDRVESHDVDVEQAGAFSIRH